MNPKCEITGCSNNAQPERTTSGYELCIRHYGQWSEQNMTVTEDAGRVTLEAASG